MTKFREVCKATRKPLRWVSAPEAVTERCGFGECKSCTSKYLGDFSYLQSMWSNKYSLCFNAREDELFDYGTLEVKHGI
jgi:hypothetical protein